MATNQKSESALIHARLKHPVIDSDGHWIEYEPAVIDYIAKVGGKELAERFKAQDILSLGGWARCTSAERLERRMSVGAWWGLPARNTLDRATAMAPKLLYQRLDDMGIDYAVVYPTLALFVALIREPDMRRAVCRAFNMLSADLFREFSDRLTPAAYIPMGKPEWAIEELDFAVRTLGLKAMMMESLMRRPIKAAPGNPEQSRFTSWPDTLGLDSEYDYDPVWAKCVELKVAPTFHSGSQGVGLRFSPTNFVYNHIGHFGAAGEAVCKSIFMNGVTRRFPTLKFAFLEGGVGWACSLFSDLIGHWKKRNPGALEEVNPANLDVVAIADLLRRYGPQAVTDHLGELDGLRKMLLETPESRDDFARCGITRPEDIRDLFVPNFYFGCEADDPINSWAFNSKVNPFGARLGAIIGSDIGHFDVADMTEVLAEAHELLEHGQITEEDFHDFVFGNPVHFWSGMNPDFFRGTVVERQAAELMAGQGSHQQSAAAGS
jgi:predicted TIM-barrel fold metal-dependent hydrolase